MHNTSADKNILQISRPPVRLFNTETRKIEMFQSAQPPKLTLYTCGPTVYNYAHIGNFRTYVFEDLLRRTLKMFGYQVIQAMNLTDVDDKTIRGAMQQGVSLEEYVQPYKVAFFADLFSLGIERVEYYPAATDYISEMIDVIQSLIDQGFAYRSPDQSVYFSIDRFPQYGRLSHLCLDQLQSGTRDAIALRQDEYDKEQIADFALWKAYDPARDGGMYWDSPFGPGRPGWHIECSAMAMALLGTPIDIHVGAVDNIFPHHENEIAQSECCKGARFVRHWLHSEHLIVNGKKMSKSAGNFYTLRDLLDQGYQGREVRYLLLQTHYRTQLNFTFEGIEAARHALMRLDSFVQRVQQQAQQAEPTSAGIQWLSQVHHQFLAALADDLNISVALAVLFDLVRDGNTAIDQGNLSAGDASLLLLLLEEWNRVLNVLEFTKQLVPAEVMAWVNERQEARRTKNWDQADTLRKHIEEAGFRLEDTPQGVQVRKK